MNKKHFNVFINGENFLIDVKKKGKRKRGKAGFYTTCFVQADTAEEAEEKAVEMLRSDPKLKKVVLNKDSDPPVMNVQEIYQMKGAIKEDDRLAFVWYTQDDDAEGVEIYERSRVLI